jgi:hypothetical protein
MQCESKTPSLNSARPEEIVDYLIDPRVSELAGIVIGILDPEVRRLVIEVLIAAVDDASNGEAGENLEDNNAR